MVRGRFSTQGALRDPGLWYTTLRGKWFGVDSQPRVRFAISKPVPFRSLRQRRYIQSPGSPLRRTLGGKRQPQIFDPNPGCASRPWALVYNPFGVHGSRGRFPTQGALRDSQPRVRFATLGFGIEPLRGKCRGSGSIPNPGCASRRWVLVYGNNQLRWNLISPPRMTAWARPRTFQPA